MGEYADYMIERELDRMFSGDFDDDDGPSMGTCRHCGKRIEFVHSGVRWRLYEPGAVKPHACPPVIAPSELQPIVDDVSDLI